RGYRRPGVATAILAAALLESFWLAGSGLRHKAFGVQEATVDSAFGLGALLAMAAATTPEQRTASMNWMLPYTVAASAGVAVAVPDRRHGAIAVTALSAMYAATVVRPGSRGAGRFATALANTLSFGGFWLVTRLFADMLRHLASQVDEATAT